jgi:uncharacterized phage infection (PIP) family protein YhgE
MLKLQEAIKKPLIVESGKILSGEFARLGVFNENGRNYPRDVYTPAYEAISSKIPARRLVGELDHPMSYDEVRLTNVSHVITECQINEDGTVTGKVELLDTPAGKVAQALAEAGIPLGISSRGLGATKQLKEGNVEVTKLKLITFDLVAEPSFKTAILDKSVYEGLQESLNAIEESLPLNESTSEQTASVKKMIDGIRTNVVSEEQDAIRLAEALALETPESLREALTITHDQVAHLTALNEAKGVELAQATQLINSQQTIINQVKTRLLESAAVKDAPVDISMFIDSIGELTVQLAESNSKFKDAETRLEASDKRMEELQEGYNKLTDDLDTKVNESETLLEQVVVLRKKLALESRGLAWDKYSPILEGMTTDREISDKLKSLRHLTNVSKGVDPQKVAESLQESLATRNQTDNSRRLANIIARA